MSLEALTGPAVIAAIVSGAIAVVSLWVNRSTTINLHSEKLAADQRLAERRVEAEITLAERKVSLDRALADWKRRTELAETVLADFYKMRDIFLAARTPFAFAGEGASRAREPDESEVDGRHRDAVYAPYERLSKERDFIADLQAKRFRFMALFGPDASAPSMTFVQLFNQIGVATRALINDRRHLTEQQQQRFETLIGWVMDETDPIKEQIDQAVASLEAICRPVLEVRPE